MEQNIEDYITEVKLRAKRIRRKSLKFFITLLFSSLFLILVRFLVTEYFPTLLIGGTDFILATSGLFFGMALVLVGNIMEPLRLEDKLFIRLYEATKLYEKSTQGVFKEEALGHLKNAYNLLKRIYPDRLSFYKEMNMEIERLTEIIKGIVANAQSNKLELTDLKKILSVLASPTLANVKAVNDGLWEKYHGKELQEFGFKYHLSRFYATTFGRGVISLMLGYMLITVISFIYCLLVKVDFILFCRQNPSVIIMGGAILSGFSFFGKRQA